MKLLICDVVVAVDVVDTKSLLISHIICTPAKNSFLYLTFFIVSAPVFGDPHVITLDGRNYTFNGLGEYTMINIKDNFFQLQARTKLAKGGGTATVFSAAVAKEQNTSIVQCNLKEEGEVRFDPTPCKNTGLSRDRELVFTNVAE